MLHWKLQDKVLDCSRLNVPPEGENAGCTAMHCSSEGLTVADAGGALWQLPHGGASAECNKVAELPQERVMGIAVGEENAVVSTAGGAVIKYRLMRDGGWMQEQELKLDGAVQGLMLEPQLHEGLAATSSATVW